MRSEIDRLIADIKASRKYGHVASSYIRSIASQELGKRRSYNEALKATRNKLHQVGGAYLDGNMPYKVWLDELRYAVQTGHDIDVRDTCLRIMSHHASSRERLEGLEQFYTTIFDAIPPVHSVLDVACGLNPLAIPWMNLAPDAVYYAVDIYEDMLDFVGSAIGLFGYGAQTIASSIHDLPPLSVTVDLALVLKTIPCLEQVDKSAGARLLDMVRARYIVISYPVHSLCGHSKGMAWHYESQFHRLVSDRNWRVKQLSLRTELAFLIDTQPC